jgi:hypothetical protein
MPVDAGNEIAGRKAIDISSRKGAEKRAAADAVKAATEDTQNARDQRLG